MVVLYYLLYLFLDTLVFWECYRLRADNREGTFGFFQMLFLIVLHIRLQIIYSSYGKYKDDNVAAYFQSESTVYIFPPKDKSELHKKYAEGATYLGLIVASCVSSCIIFFFVPKFAPAMLYGDIYIVKRLWIVILNVICPTVMLTGIDEKLEVSERYQVFLKELSSCNKKKNV